MAHCIIPMQIVNLPAEIFEVSDARFRTVGRWRAALRHNSPSPNGRVLREPSSNLSSIVSKMSTYNDVSTDFGQRLAVIVLSSFLVSSLGSEKRIVVPLRSSYVEVEVKFSQSRKRYWSGWYAHQMEKLSELVEFQNISTI